jgi:peptidoglycan hydrolase-like protein with peptidoglycan-binding domain
MLLRKGDSGEDVKSLQRGLNKLGSILLVDGDFGPATRDAVVDGRVVLQRPGPPEADDALQHAISEVPDPFPPLTAAGVTFIARAEVSGPRNYRLKFKNPVWPSPKSGITIGIGYDLSSVSRDQLRADWADHLLPDAIIQLDEVLGKPGSADRLGRVRDIEVPLPDAVTVFLQRSLPDYLERARSIYPQIDDLTPSRRTALLSIVYNRGTRLQDSDPVREERLEMRTIRKLLAEGRFDAVADQMDAMSRLWDPGKLPGLVQRRHDEARLWRSGFVVLQLA